MDVGSSSSQNGRFVTFPAFSASTRVRPAGALTALRPLLQAGRAAELGAGLSTGTIKWRDTALVHTLVVTGAPVEWSTEMIR